MAKVDNSELKYESVKKEVSQPFNDQKICPATILCSPPYQRRYQMRKRKCGTTCSASSE